MDIDKTWRAFEQNEISHSAAHYLMTVHSFLKGGFEPRPADLARRLGISRAAVSNQLKTLSTHGYLTIGETKRIELTSSGFALVERLNGKRIIVEDFLKNFLGLSANVAEEDSCKIEHLISEETAAALSRLSFLMHSEKDFEKSERKTIDKLLRKLKTKSKLQINTREQR
jgi:Mn-dependent DtxR family transcriptional regulator